jgi:hypothetical protein
MADRDFPTEGPREHDTRRFHTGPPLPADHDLAAENRSGVEWSRRPRRRRRIINRRTEQPVEGLRLRPAGSTRRRHGRGRAMVFPRRWKAGDVPSEFPA